MSATDKIQAVIVEDEKEAIQSLMGELNLNCPDVEVVKTGSTVEEGYRAIKEVNPDLVFLDIDLGERSSFEILDLIDTIDFQVIFVTAHNDFAIKAIKYSALDYILKPAGGTDLIQAVNRVKQKINKTESFSLLKEQIVNQTFSKKIALQTGEKIELVNIYDIHYCESDGNYTRVITGDKKLYVSRSLKDLDFLLSSHGFYRTHRSFLVNPQKIKSYVQSDGGYILMEDGKDVPISKRKKEDFLQTLKLMGAR